MTPGPWLGAALALLAGAAGFRQLEGWVYLFQLDEYLPRRLLASSRRRLRARLPWQLALLAGALALAALAALVGRAGSHLEAVPLALACLLPLALGRPFASRSRLRWTGRCRRLASLAGAICLLLLWLGFQAGPWGALLVGVLDLLVVLSLLLSELAWRPYEANRRRRFMGRAESRLSSAGSLVVGITGSYGKTTCKVLLAQLLDRRGEPCFATPGSFNTTLGVCRAINEGLPPSCPLALVEMGAYRPGEIAEICSFTHPRAGVVTSVGIMHLERFGSRRRIAEAKGELLAALPPDGFAVIPSDIAERETLTRGLRARLVTVGAPGDRWWAEGRELATGGTSFRLRGNAGEALPLTVPLFGVHLLQDLLCALAVAAELGRTPEELAALVPHLEGAPHRLQVSQQGGVTIIDDAYNSNPEGAAEALSLLAALPGQRRVLVTPGYVELGPEQEQRMRELGRRAAAVCTHVILVGARQAAAVQAGLGEAGYPPHQVSVVADLGAVQRLLPEVAGPGSVVLFENDLPDQYLERG